MYQYGTTGELVEIQKVENFEQNYAFRFNTAYKNSKS